MPRDFNQPGKNLSHPIDAFEFLPPEFATGASLRRLR